MRDIDLLAASLLLAIQCLCITHQEHFLTSAAMHAGQVFQPNLQDPRFKSLFTSSDFALDPTDPRFQQADGSSTIAKAVSKQRQQNVAHAPLGTTAADNASNQLQGQSAMQQHGQAKLDVTDAAAVQLKSMIASLKRKASKASKVPAKTDKPVKQKKKQRVT